MGSSTENEKPIKFSPTFGQSLLLILNYIFLAIWTPGFFGVAMFDETPGNGSGKHMLVHLSIFGLFLTLVSVIRGRYLIAKETNAWRTTSLLLAPLFWFLICLVIFFKFPRL